MAVVMVGGMVEVVREVKMDAVAVAASSNAQRPRSPDNQCRAGSLHNQILRRHRRKTRPLRIRDDWCIRLCKGIQAAAARARQAAVVVAAEPAGMVRGAVGVVREVKMDAVAVAASSSAQRPRSPDNPCRAYILQNQSHRPRRHKTRPLSNGHG